VYLSSSRTTVDASSTAVTEHPTATRTAQKLRNAFPENEAPGTCCTMATLSLQISRQRSPDEPASRAHGRALAMAESLRETRHRHDPTCLDHIIVLSAAPHRVLMANAVRASAVSTSRAEWDIAHPLDATD